MPTRKLHPEIYVGNKYGRWTVETFGGRDKHRQEVWMCRCECGTISKRTRIELVTGRSKSCGCLKADLKRTHGYTHKSEYTIYWGMLDRCYNPNNENYRLYGGRGIIMCDRWRDNFLNFLSDMGNKPFSSASIDRINNNGNYEPSNCRWATRVEQSRNMSTTVKVERNGVMVAVADLADEKGMSVSGLKHRILKLGMSVEDAMRVPVMSRSDRVVNIKGRSSMGLVNVQLVKETKDVANG